MDNSSESPWLNLTKLFRDQFGNEPDWASRTEILRERFYIPEGGEGDWFDTFACRVWRIQRFELTNEFYSIQETEKILAEIESSLEEANRLLLTLPPNVYFELEHLATKRLENAAIKHLQYTSLTKNSDFEKFHESLLRWVLFRPIHHFFDLLKDIRGPIKSRSQHESYFDHSEVIGEKSLFTQAMENTAPKRNINFGRSKSRILKVQIVDELRFLWKVVYQTEAPRSVPDEGSAFGDFVEKVFDAIQIKANVRASVEAWNKENKPT